jgi:hypothetical protein
MGEPPIEVVQEEEGEEPRKPVWVLEQPGQVATPWHPQLVLCEPKIEDEAELRFAQTHGVGLFEVGVRVDKSGGKRR